MVPGAVHNSPNVDVLDLGNTIRDQDTWRVSAYLKVMARWSEKVVVVAGGSQGLGLHLAREYHSLGARLVLLARNPDRLRNSVEELESLRAESACGWQADLTDDEDRSTVVSRISERYGRVDVWVNAVGESIRIRFDDATIADYRRMMEQNLYASLGCSLAALPLLAKTNGCLINIGSLAGLVSWPYLAPYIVSKHALTAFARQLRVEGPSNVRSLLVCTGPIASDDVGRYDDQVAGLPTNAAAPGAGAPVGALDPQRLAKKIIRSAERGMSELIVPWKARLLLFICDFSPRIGQAIIRRFT